MMSVGRGTEPKNWKAISSAYGLCQLVVTDVGFKRGFEQMVTT